MYVYVCIFIFCLFFLVNQKGKMDKIYFIIVGYISEI